LAPPVASEGRPPKPRVPQRHPIALLRNSSPVPRDRIPASHRAASNGSQHNVNDDRVSSRMMGKRLVRTPGDQIVGESCYDTGRSDDRIYGDDLPGHLLFFPSLRPRPASGPGTTIADKKMLTGSTARRNGAGTRLCPGEIPPAPSTDTGCAAGSLHPAAPGHPGVGAPSGSFSPKTQPKVGS
jgi:hypothetical protein